MHTNCTQGAAARWLWSINVDYRLKIAVIHGEYSASHASNQCKDIHKTTRSHPKTI
jgi:hypothetical protein